MNKVDVSKLPLYEFVPENRLELVKMRIEHIEKKAEANNKQIDNDVYVVLHGIIEHIIAMSDKTYWFNLKMFHMNDEPTPDIIKAIELITELHKLDTSFRYSFLNDLDALVNNIKVNGPILDDTELDKAHIKTHYDELSEQESRLSKECDELKAQNKKLQKKIKSLENQFGC